MPTVDSLWLKCAKGLTTFETYFALMQEWRMHRRLMNLKLQYNSIAMFIAVLSFICSIGLKSYVVPLVLVPLGLLMLMLDTSRRAATAGGLLPFLRLHRTTYIFNFLFSIGICAASRGSPPGLCMGLAWLLIGVEIGYDNPPIQKANAKRAKFGRYFLSSAVLAIGVFILISMFVGGAAITGKIEDGRYYLGNHSVYTEVSLPVYVMSAAATVVVPFWMALAVYLSVRSEAYFKSPFSPLALIVTSGFALVALVFMYGSIACIVKALR